MTLLSAAMKASLMGFLLSSATAYAACAPSEAHMYSAQVGAKTVAICASPATPPYSKVEYRFGPLGQPEMTYTADGKSGKQFYAEVEALSPRATVYYFWFMNGDYTYVVGACVGGCKRNGGILVKQGNRTVAKLQTNDWPEISNDIVDFVGGPTHSGIPVSRTPLVELKSFQSKGMDPISELFER